MVFLTSMVDIVGKIDRSGVNTLCSSNSGCSGIYPDYANPELLERIPLTARTILDVGCGQGALGLAYRRRNPCAHVLGIEINPDAARRAALRLSQVACVDVESNPMPFTLSDSIDCIVYGDILEHLVDPWQLLSAHAEYLSPDGTVLICMPNLEHWSFTLRLINGTFNYEPQGLLDRSHLRWFTPRNMARALMNVGLQLADVVPRPVDIDDAERFVRAMTPGLLAIGVDPQEYLNRAAPLQFIWRARRSAPPRIVLCATALPPLGGVTEVRVTEPVNALRSDSSVLAFIEDEEKISLRLGETPHIAILHRPLLHGATGLERIKALHSKGFLIVTEFDDHPSFMADRGVELNEVMSFKGVHAIQTTTPELAATLRLENPEVAVFPNAILALPEVQNFIDPEHLTFFFGALNRMEDWKSFMPTINQVAHDAGAQLRFSVVHDRSFFDALDTPHKQFSETCDYPTYLKLLGQSEIAFMPLLDTPFNRAKSDLKFIEAAAARVSVLASSVVYGEVVESGRTGSLFRDSAQLRSSLLGLLSNPSAARELADAGRQYVAEKRMLAYQIEGRSRWYRSLWQRRDALDIALRARAPALFT